MAEETNPFKKLAETHEAPPALKERVMTSVELSQLFIEITELFTDKMGKTAIDLFKTDDEEADSDSEADRPTQP